MKKTRAVSLLLLCCMLTGCVKRTPLGTVTPAPATRITATLTDSGTVVMSNALGAGALEIEGVVLQATEDAWTLQLLRVNHRDQRSIPWNREQVTFPRRTLINPTVVVLDKKRSWLAAAGVTVTAFLVARAFNLLGADESTGNVPPPPASVVP